MIKMKVSEIQSHSVSHRVSVPFPVHWSEDDVIATATDKGIQIMKSSPPIRRLKNNTTRNNWFNNMNSRTLIYVIIYIILVIVQPTLSNDITKEVFGSLTDGMPAAFGDFDSDKFTDLFVLRNNATTIEILLGDDTEPLLKQKDKLSCTFNDGKKITSVVPGDFNGDALMDVLVTVRGKTIDSDLPHLNFVYVLWGDGEKLHCDTDKYLFKIYGQPLAVDCNQDMIIDLFGLNEDKKRGFWIYNNRTMKFKEMNLPDHPKLNDLRIPHSHAFLDLNHDSYGDLYLTTDNGSAEVWLYDSYKKDFEFSHTIEPPPGVDIVNKPHYIGQTVFQDMALEGRVNQLVPVCFDVSCKNSTIYLRSNNHWHNIKVHFNDWHFVNPNGKDGGHLYLNTLTLRAGDFNMDGYPDLLATLVNNRLYRTYLLENIECKSNCDGFSRTFQVRDELNQYNNNTILGAFYDFLQDGVLDVILVHDKPLRVSAYRNNLDYDANFVKVMVLTGMTNYKKSDEFHLPLGKKQRIYGTNLPGPTILYNTTTQEGNPRSAISTQLPQSAYFSLSLPYTIFGLGRTPNFVDELTVGVYGHKRSWTQLIPNSQMVVIPSPTNDPSQWKAQLFVTPSKLILQSVFALLGTCALISLIIGALYWKERKEDHKEKLQEAQKFHFDAM